MKKVVAKPVQNVRLIAQVLIWLRNKSTSFLAPSKKASFHFNSALNTIADCEMSSDYSPIQHMQIEQSELKNSETCGSREKISLIRFRRENARTILVKSSEPKKSELFY